VALSINTTVGDATAPQGEGAKVIVHVCNDVGGWGRGFVMALSRRWPEPEAQYRDWYSRRDENDFLLGNVQFVEVEPELWVANLIGQHGLRPSGGRPPVRYDAIRAGLAKVGEFAIRHAASVHMPRIGCGLAGGNWEEVEAIVRETLSERDVTVTVYDFG
jgi:O-acetyl-ADP-ribose deacetylase (regulator of RNase III)